MWGYYVALALRSSGRSKALTALVITLLAFGVAACMVSYAVFRATTSDPIPSRSSRLYVPFVDNFGPDFTYQGEPGDMLSCADAMALLHAKKAARQTVLYPTTWWMASDNGDVPPRKVTGDAVTADFFPMFDVPFLYGSAWTQDDDGQHGTVVVISRALNERLFGGRNSVGKELRLDGKLFRVAGVLDHWNPKPRFYDAILIGLPDAYADAGDVYMPFARAVDMKKDSKYTNCPTASGWEDTTASTSSPHGECTWLGMWVELPTAADAARYSAFLTQYAAEQQRLGRFAWAPNVRLRNLADFLVYEHIAPKVSGLSMLVSASFLMIVLVNVVGLMLARFMRRAPEIGVRRALGASRAAIYRQFLIEGATMGFVGGVLGVMLTGLGVWGIGGLFEPKIARLVHADASLMALTVVLAVVATVVSALYPTWRAAQTQPAWQIKING
ncbi:FtsX-like permease family protein [Luteibacter pinisoli]|uniref:FtsX-like permease family protein n=1 Tax=Luteibacter pinisoli TaxID=2589080 RepID=A0A4Y5Z9Z1_9GAMM|nr:ABC transporter permease [Luteibacter pinisoli]QDE41035.1 FtsX-like permease family protein [Luteibacter pinisoli]